MREIGESGDPLVDLPLQNGGVDPVRGDVLDVERLDIGPHGPQRGARRGEMGPLALKGVVRVRRGRVRYVRGARQNLLAFGGMSEEPPGFRPDGGAPWKARREAGGKENSSQRHQGARMIFRAPRADVRVAVSLP
ncbi:hypothetical protein GCM10020000_33650 [Streptomyces olivoverticillatus]